MTEVAEAQTLILDRMPRFDAREEPLAACIDRVLGRDVLADRDQPPFDRVTMDGIAIAYEDWSQGTREFRIVGTQAAGARALSIASAGQCIEVMTGAMLPERTDCVIPVERVEQDGEIARVAEGTRASERQFIHARGTDRVAGSLLLEKGTRIGPPEVAVLASAGRSTVAVTALPRVAVISTGDELVDVDGSIEPYQIRSTNDWALEAMLTRHKLGITTRAHLKDDVATLVDAIGRLHESNDVLILSGGVSMGKFDFVPSVLETIGAELVFHRIEQRPGRPMWFGQSAAAKPIFALPGNPVSALVCAARYIVPALQAAAGLRDAPREHVALVTPVELKANLTLFMPVKLTEPAGATAIAEPRAPNTSGDFMSLAGTDGFVELPRAQRLYPKGAIVRLFRW